MPGGYSGLYPSLNGQKPPKTFEEKVIEWGGTKSISLAYEICDDLYYGMFENDLDAEELIADVMLWGREKKLNDPKAQLNKVIEEVGEIAHEITRNNYDSDELEDAIGDSMVTLIILADILGMNPVECLDEAYCAIRRRKGSTKEGTFVKEQ